MPRPIIRKRRFASKILLLLVLVAAGVAALWWLRFREHAPGRSVPRTPAPELVRLEGSRALLGSEARIVAFAAEESPGRQALEAAFRRAAEIQAICSGHDAGSELSKLTSAPAGRPVTISPTLAAVLAHAHATAEVTDGLVDPTLGTLTDLWSKSLDSRTLPETDEIARATAASGWSNFTVDPGACTITLRKAGMRFDLGGIVKGFAADEMLAVLESRGLNRALVTLGRDVRAGHPPPGRPGWQVGIQTLGAGIEEIITVSRCAVCTSGGLYESVEIDGIPYSSILDPATGLGLTRRIAATVVAPTATQCAPFATFACIAPESALRAFSAGEISCRIATLKDLRPTQHTTRNFPPVSPR